MKDLLGLKDLSAVQLGLILARAFSYKKQFGSLGRIKKVLADRHILTLFYEPSTRTLTSFNVAAGRLGARVNNISVSGSSIQKGETLIDTIRNLEVLGFSAVIIRHTHGGAPRLAADNTKMAVINAGDGFNEHPTQALLDIMTMQQYKGSLKKKKIVIVGDIAHSRVARSNIWGLLKLGASVTVSGPATLIPKGIEDFGVRVEHDLDRALSDADFVNVLRMQHERQADQNFIPSKREYHRLFGINEKRLARAKPRLLVLHPGPLNRSVEISSGIADGGQNVILEQVVNGIAVRMAVLTLLIGRAKNA
ncbi:MAG: aspartate carbamoyltransferase catalytic subunit [Candidatus Margulisbacteria bacterium]|jgi:aspartate carbamoyltransferase catalytic subunit|nr:aspartate carbamoyltransferase catalytic subunit [Candidatus Margulisiibacteriota bacterium]